MRLRVSCEGKKIHHEDYAYIHVGHALLTGCLKNSLLSTIVNSVAFLKYSEVSFGEMHRVFDKYECVAKLGKFYA